MDIKEQKTEAMSLSKWDTLFGENPDNSIWIYLQRILHGYLPYYSVRINTYGTTMYADRYKGYAIQFSMEWQHSGY